LEKYIFESDDKILLDKFCDKVENLLSVKKEKRPRINSSFVTVIEIAAYIAVIASFENAEDPIDDTCEVMSKWSALMMMLMDSDLETNIDISRVKETIQKIARLAPTANHLYVLIDVIHTEVSRLV